jgi:CRISPR-associated protein Csa3
MQYRSYDGVCYFLHPQTEKNASILSLFAAIFLSGGIPRCGFHSSENDISGVIIIEYVTKFVSTLGFDTSHLQSLIVEEEVEDGDNLVLIRPDDDDARGEKAVQSIEGTIDMIDVELTTEVKEFAPGGFEETTKKIVDTLDSTTEDIVVNLGGGDRFLLISLSTAVTVTSSEIKSIHVRSDVTRESYEVQLPKVRPCLSDRDRSVLEYVVNNEPVNNTQVAAMTGKSNSTVHRSLESLQEIGYIEIEDKGGENSIRATFSGNLVEKKL